LIIIILNTFLFLFIIFSHGIFFTKKVLKINKFQGFYEISIYGLIFTIFLSQFLNYFFALNNTLLISNLILILIFFFFNKNLFISNIKLDLKVFTIFILLAFLQIYGSGYSDDLDHYHYSYIINTDNHPFIWGNSFLHNMFGTAPIWLTTNAYLNFDFSRLQDIHIVNGIFLFLIFGLFFSELLSSKQNSLYKNPLIFSIFLFLLIKYTRLKEFGIDRPAILLFCFFIFYYLKYFVYSSKKDINLDFLILLLIAICIVSIKIIYVPIFIFIFFVYFNHRKKIFFLGKKFIIAYLAVAIFILKNILSTGCVIFPISLTCIETLVWVNFNGAKELSFLAEYFNKSWTSYNGTLSKSEYIQDFNWFKTWFSRGKTEIIEIFLTSFSIVFLTLVAFKIRLNKQILIKKLNLFGYALISIILLSTFIYFWKNPVIRMNHHVILSLILLLVLYFCDFKINNQRKIMIPLILILFISYNCFKNINRIIDYNFINDPISKIKEKVREQKKFNISSFIYYVGWFGNTPISQTKLKKKNYKKHLIFDILSNKKN